MDFKPISVFFYLLGSQISQHTESCHLYFTASMPLQVLLPAFDGLNDGIDTPAKMLPNLPLPEPKHQPTVFL